MTPTILEKDDGYAYKILESGFDAPALARARKPESKPIPQPTKR